MRGMPVKRRVGRTRKPATMSKQQGGNPNDRIPSARQGDPSRRGRKATKGSKPC